MFYDVAPFWSQRQLLLFEKHLRIKFPSLYTGVSDQPLFVCPELIKEFFRESERFRMENLFS